MDENLTSASQGLCGEKILVHLLASKSTAQAHFFREDTGRKSLRSKFVHAKFRKVCHHPFVMNITLHSTRVGYTEFKTNLTLWMKFG
jgi:hypothetical protein